MPSVRFEKGADEEAINLVSMFIRDLERQDFEANFSSVREGLEIAAEHADMIVTAYLDDEPVAIFGVGFKDGIAVPWMALTEEVTSEGLKVARHARAWSRVIQKKYGFLQNLVMSKDQPAIDLLEFCEFEINTSCHVQMNGLDYNPFWYGERN